MEREQIFFLRLHSEKELFIIGKGITMRVFLLVFYWQMAQILIAVTNLSS